MKTSFTVFSAVFICLFNSIFCSAQSVQQENFSHQLPVSQDDVEQYLNSTPLMYANSELYVQLLKCKNHPEVLQQLLINKQILEALTQFSNNKNLTNFKAVSKSGKAYKTEESNFALVKDINQAKNSYPNNFNFRFNNNYAVIDSVVYYSADDGIHGTELWRSDGTVAGTYMVKDIFPGVASSQVFNITVFKHKLYFRATDGVHGYELYQSNGTAAGTILLKDINAGSENSFPQRFTAVNGYLFFTVGTNYWGTQLWKTDGTVQGTNIVYDFYNQSSSLAQLTAVGKLLFFTEFNQNSVGREVWRSDGTANGTYLIKDVSTDNNNESYDDLFYSPSNLTSFKNHLYYSTYINNGRYLVETDGTYAGTKYIQNNGAYLYNAFTVQTSLDEPFATTSTSIFFVAQKASTGTELYNYNPSLNSGVALVKNITPGAKSTGLYSEYIYALNDTVYFSVPDSTFTKFSLWRSEGNSSNTKKIKDLPGSAYNIYADVNNNKLYLSVRSIYTGTEPWISDGTSSGTKILKNIVAGSNSSNPYSFTACNGKIYFAAYSDTSDVELWSASEDGTEVKLIKDANITSSASALDYYNFNNQSAVRLDKSAKIIFNATQNSTGNAIWISDGTASGTNLIADLIPGENSYAANYFYTKKGKVYFTAIDSLLKRNIYSTNGTTAGTKKILQLDSLNKYVEDLKVADNGNIFYTTQNSIDFTTHLWRADSLGNKVELNNNVDQSSIEIAQNTCFFAGINSYGYELWKSDGTVSGTVMVKDINPGSGDSRPGGFKALNNKVLFSATTDLYNRYLWVSDGTEAGTLLLKKISPGTYNACVFKSKLYFSGYDATYGSELYSSDGTKKGTHLVKDIYSGTASSFPSNLTATDSTVFFTANDGINEHGLWKTLGAEGNTKFIENILPDSTGTYNLTDFTTAANKLYFLNNNSVLWTSDGTAYNTYVVSDSGLGGIDRYSYLVGAGNKLYIAANTHMYGNELYVGIISQNAKNLTANKVEKPFNDPQLNARLLTNPFINNLNIEITSVLNQQVNVIITNSVGQIMSNITHSINSGLNQISINTNQWLPGIYKISLVTKTGVINLNGMK